MHFQMCIGIKAAKILMEHNSQKPKIKKGMRSSPIHSSPQREKNNPRSKENVEPWERERNRQISGLDEIDSQLEEVDHREQIKEQYPHLFPQNPLHKQFRTMQETLLHRGIRQMQTTCLCGQLLDGPMSLFVHIKNKHQNEDVQKVHRLKTVNQIFKRAPNNTLAELVILQELNSDDFDSEFRDIVGQYRPEQLNTSKALGPAQNKGTYADLAYKVMNEIGSTDSQKLFLSQFFICIQHFITRRYSQKHWEETAAGQLLTHANHLFHYYRAVNKITKKRLAPFKDDHFKRLLLGLTKWMMIKGWTPHRLFRTDGGEAKQYLSQPKQPSLVSPIRVDKTPIN